MMHYDAVYPDWNYPDDDPVKRKEEKTPDAFACKNCGEPWGIDYGFCEACTPPNHPNIISKRERERKRKGIK